MKKFIFLMGIGMFFLISCSSNKKIAKDVNLFSQSQKDSITPLTDTTVAKEMIAGFPRHKYRGWQKKHLRSAFVKFDLTDLRTIINDSNVDSIKFFDAVLLKSQSSKWKKVPTLVLKVYATEQTGKSSTVQSSVAYYTTSIYDICPPPSNCTLRQ